MKARKIVIPRSNAEETSLCWGSFCRPLTIACSQHLATLMPQSHVGVVQQTGEDGCWEACISRPLYCFGHSHTRDYPGMHVCTHFCNSMLNRQRHNGIIFSSPTEGLIFLELFRPAFPPLSSRSVGSTRQVARVNRDRSLVVIHCSHTRRACSL